MPHWGYRDELSIQDALVLKGQQVLIPGCLRKEVKARIHSAHLGVDGCLRSARVSCFWPRMSSDLKKSLHPQEEVSRPWEKVGSALFTPNRRTYLITDDCYSNFCEIEYLPTTTAAAIINKTKARFARHGSPDCVD